MTRHEIELRIDELHDEAEEIAACAKFARSADRAAELREDAKRKVREAARLRAQLDEA